MSGKLYNVGLYIRLSRENTEYVGNDSMSLENQEAMLSKFIAMMPGWVETRTYIDNGASGGNFNRQGFRDMMEDIRNGVINLVLVQDLSRFGRNYLETGKYLEEELPALGCRFVALADGVDTEDGENDIMPFLNAMNDFYLKNLSDRIKSVFQAKAKAGHKLTGTPPYGYMRSPEDKTRLIVDECAAEVVKRIFEMRAEGFGYTKIIRELNCKNISPPRLYYYQRNNREPIDKCSNLWRIHTLPAMLKDECYIGHTNSFKESKNYRSGKKKRTKKDGWLKIENTHEAIISQELWDKVQEANTRLSKWAKNIREPQSSLYVKKIFCADCGTPMSSIPVVKDKITDERRNVYSCAKYNATGRENCSRHGIREEVINKVLLNDIRKQTEQIRLDENRMTENLLQKLSVDYAVETADSNKRLQNLKLELHQLDIKLEQLYEDKIVGNISSDTFSKMSKKTEQHRSVIAEEIERLEKSKATETAKRNDIQKWTRLIKENMTVIDIDRPLLDALVERIEIGESKVENGVKTQEVKIFYKLVGVI